MFKQFFSLQCHAWGLSDVGHARTHNEDHILLNEANNLFLLADGMGGHQRGDIASEMAVNSITELLLNSLKGSAEQSAYSTNDIEMPEVNRVIEAISATNVKIYTENQKRGLAEGKGMGTTIVGCWYLPTQKQALIFHAGDSRAYSVYKKELTCITRDHSLLELWKDNSIDGEKPAANVLTKALGPFKTVTPDISIYPLKKGENLLLCSDGLSNMLTDEEILSIFIDQKNHLPSIPQYLIEKANQSGGEDNISAIVINFF